MPKVTESQLQRERRDSQLTEIQQKTGKEFTIEHMGSGNYWLRIIHAPGRYEQFGDYGYLKEKELNAFVNGLHAGVCGAQLNKK